MQTRKRTDFFFDFDFSLPSSTKPNIFQNWRIDYWQGTNPVDDEKKNSIGCLVQLGYLLFWIAKSIFPY